MSADGETFGVGRGIDHDKKCSAHRKTASRRFPSRTHGRTPDVMSDVLYVGATLGAFAGLVGLVRLCDAVVRSGHSAGGRQVSEPVAEEVAP